MGPKDPGMDTQVNMLNKLNAKLSITMFFSLCSCFAITYILKLSNNSQNRNNSF